MVHSGSREDLQFAGVSATFNSVAFFQLFPFVTVRQGTSLPWNVIDTLWCDHTMILLEKKKGHKAKSKTALTSAISHLLFKSQYFP